MTRKALALVVIVGALFSGRTFAGDWPHWRGPFLNGAADEKNLPGTWSQTETIAWVSPLPGHSGATPVISNGRVFVSSTDSRNTDLLALCFDAGTGKELWRRKLGTSARKVPRNNMATPSPVTDGKSVYFMYGSGELAGLDYDGNILWTRNIEAEYGNISIKYGYSSSPLLYDNKLYVLIQRRHMHYRPPESTTLDAFILAVNPKTGKNIWKQPRKTDALDGKSSKTLTCLDAKTGTRRWQAKLGGVGPWRASVTAADDKLYCINESAEAVVIAADAKEFKIISRIDMGDKPVQASIAIADEHLFIRTASKLFCVGD